MLSKQLSACWALIPGMVFLICCGADAQRVMPGVNLSGGAKDIVGSAFFGEQVNLVYAQPSGAGSMQGIFDIPGLSSEPMFVYLKATDDDFAEITPIKITLNGQVVFEGENPFPQAPTWGIEKFPIGESVLNAGENTLIIENMAEEGVVGMPPWFMVAMVAIAEESFDFNDLPATPTTPTNLSAEAVGGFQIDLSWTDNSTDEIGFWIERRENIDGTTFVKIATVPDDVTSYSDEGVLPARSYIYRVRAFNDGGFSAYSTDATATTEEILIVELDNQTPAQFKAIINQKVQLGVEVFFASEDPIFQWYKAGISGGNPIPVGNDAPVLFFDSIRYEDAGVYWCEVTSGAEVVNSPEINLSVSEALPIAGVGILVLLTLLLALASIHILHCRYNCSQ